MKNILSLKTVFAIIILIIISLIINSFNLFIIFVSIGLLYKMFSPITNTKIFDSKVLYSTLIMFCYFTLLQCAVLISWVINKNFPLSFTPILMLVIIFIMSLYDHLVLKKSFVNKDQMTNRKTITFHDIISILISVIICFVVFIMPLRGALGSGFEKQTLSISLVSGNVDDTAHLALINDRLQFNRGVLLGSDSIDKTRSLGFYPAGWHSISAVIIKMFLPNVKVGIESLLAYGIQKLFWLFILFYLLIRGTLSIYVFISNKKLKIISSLFVSGASTLIGVVFIIPIIQNGFYSFIPQLISALLTLMIIIQIHDDQGRNKSSKLLPLLFIIGIGGCLPWLLPIPVFLLSTLVIIISLSKEKKFIKSCKNIINIIKEYLIIISVISIALLTQLIVMLNNDSSESISLVKGLSLGGGIAMYDEKFYIILIVGFIICLVFFSRKIKDNINSALSLIMSLLLFCMAIYIIQMLYIGLTQYYYYKMLDILIITMIPFCVIGYDQIVEKISLLNNLSSRMIFSIVMLSGMFLSLSPSISTFGYLGGYRIFSNQMNNSIYSELENNISENNYFNNKLVFYYVPGEDHYFESELANVVTKSNERDSICFNDVRRIIWKSPDINILLDKAKQSCIGKDVSIITNKENYNIFKDAVINNNIQDIVTIKTY